MLFRYRNYIKEAFDSPELKNINIDKNFLEKIVNDISDTEEIFLHKDLRNLPDFFKNLIKNLKHHVYYFNSPNYDLYTDYINRISWKYQLENGEITDEDLLFIDYKNEEYYAVLILEKLENNLYNITFIYKKVDNNQKTYVQFINQTTKDIIRFCNHYMLEKLKQLGFNFIIKNTAN